MIRKLWHVFHAVNSGQIRSVSLNVPFCRNSLEMCSESAYRRIHHAAKKHLQTLLIKFLLELVPRNAEPCAERRSRQSARFCCEVVRPVRRSEEGLPLLPLLPRGQVPRLSLDRPLLRPCALRVLRQAPCDVVPRRGAQSVCGVSSGSAPAACSAVHAQLADRCGRAQSAVQKARRATLRHLRCLGRRVPLHRNPTRSLCPARAVAWAIG